jgi:uncharacterized protein YdhG (YjbR/CyaY superfamily)
MANSVDAYIAGFPPDVQQQIEALRTTIRAAAPEAIERISYSIIGFFIGTQHLVYLGGWKRHLALYPVPRGTAAFEREAALYRDAKSTLRFPLDAPMPLGFVTRLVKTRLKELRTTAE